MAEDIVKRIEGIAQNVFGRLEGIVGNLGPQVEREIGSERVPPDEELSEYIMTIAQAPDPVKAATDLIKEWEGSMGGLQRAQTAFVEYVERNEKRIQKLTSGSQTTNARIQNTPVIENIPTQEY